MELIVKFFLAKNMRIARERAWDQTVKSRGKGPDFWQPYFEEWQKPPVIEKGGRKWQKWIGNWAFRLLVQRGTFNQYPWWTTQIQTTRFIVILMPLNFYPFIGMFIKAWFRGVQTAAYLHKPVRLSTYCYLPLLKGYSTFTLNTWRNTSVLSSWRRESGNTARLALLLPW